MIRHIFFLFILALTAAPGYSFAQADNTLPPTTDEQLAAQYYQSGEYDKAVVYYQKLYEKSPAVVYYNYYLNCLIFTKDFKKAEKIVKRQSSRYPGDLRFHVDLARVYRAEGDEDKAKKEFEAGINAINAGTSANAIIDLSNAFLGINETDYAIAALKQGQKALKGVYSFHIELGEVYAFKKDFNAMVNEYLDLLEESVAYKQQVQNQLQNKMDADPDGVIADALKQELIKRSQHDANATIWPEMLTWYYMQQKNFSAALIQAKAVDKRKKLQGFDIMGLAQTARDNGDYGAAADAYDYVVSLGPDAPYYRMARVEKINARYDQVTKGGTYTQQDLLTLQSDMKSTLDELGRDARTVSLQLSLAHLEAFYLFNTKDAIKVLENAIAIPGITPLDQANCKLELGDVLLLDGQVWEASLRYSQVEQDFKYEPIGQEAKFRNAKIAFYIGDFKWAQVQLDVLKGSTSKLISNDAMYLSMVITDNLALDSNPDPLMMFSRADLMLFQNRFDIASLELDSIDKKYPSHSLEDDVLFMRYRISYKQQKWDSAAVFLQKIVDHYGFDILGDDATFDLAQLYDYKLGDKVKAMQYYQDVFTKYSGSLFATDARSRYRQLRGDKVAQ